MTTKQPEKIASKYTELRLVFDKSNGYYGLMTDEGLFISGITSLELNESLDVTPIVNVSIRLDK